MHVEVKYTYRDLLTAPDDGHRYEVFEGELIVTPAPSRAHQKAHSNLFWILSRYVHEHASADIYSAPVDAYFDEEIVVEPDIIFISKSCLHIVDEAKVHGAPDELVGILSPGTEQRNPGFKSKRHAKEGVKEYWIVDPKKNSLKVYTLSEIGFSPFATFTGKDQVHSPLFGGLKFDLEEILM